MDQLDLINFEHDNDALQQSLLNAAAISDDIPVHPSQVNFEEAEEVCFGCLSVFGCLCLCVYVCVHVCAYLCIRLPTCLLLWFGGSFLFFSFLFRA